MPAAAEKIFADSAKLDAARLALAEASVLFTPDDWSAIGKGEAVKLAGVDRFLEAASRLSVLQEHKRALGCVVLGRLASEAELTVSDEQVSWLRGAFSAAFRVKTGNGKRGAILPLTVDAFQTKMMQRKRWYGVLFGACPSKKFVRSTAMTRIPWSTLKEWVGATWDRSPR